MGVGGRRACCVLDAALSVYDIRQRRLPNALTLPGARRRARAAPPLTGRGLPALAGAVALASVYLVVHLVAPAGMGAGDVKLAVGVGALTGAFGVDAWVLAALGAPLLTARGGARWRSPARRARTPCRTVRRCASAAAAAVALVLG